MGVSQQPMGVSQSELTLSRQPETAPTWIEPAGWEKGIANSKGILNS